LDLVLTDNHHSIVTVRPPPAAASPAARFVVLLAAPFMAQADVTITNVATPAIHRDLGASGPILEIVIGGYLVAFAVLLITGARLGQTHGHRRILLIGLSTFTTASLVCGLAPNTSSLIAARLVQGSGAALMFPQTLTAIQRTFVGDARIRAIALYATAISSGAVIGQALGGALISADLAGTGWRAIFLINVPVGVAAIRAAARYLPPDEPHDGGRRVDLAGVTLLAAGLVLLVLPLVLGPNQDWPPWTWICLGSAAPALAAFVMVETRIAAAGRAPLVDLQAIVRPPVAWALAALTIATGTYYALLFTLAQFLQQGLGRSALVSGLTLVPWLAAFGLAGRLVARMPLRLRPMLPLGGCILLAVAYIAISVLLLVGHHREGSLVLVLAFGGLGLGINFSALIAHLADAVDPLHAPDISGVSTTGMQIGGALSIAVFGTVYVQLAPGWGATHAFSIVTTTLAAAAGLAAVAAWRATHAR
jgi:MFS family permease